MECCMEILQPSPVELRDSLLSLNTVLSQYICTAFGNYADVSGWYCMALLHPPVSQFLKIP